MLPAAAASCRFQPDLILRWNSTVPGPAPQPQILPIWIPIGRSPFFPKAVTPSLFFLSFPSSKRTFARFIRTHVANTRRARKFKAPIELACLGLCVFFPIVFPIVLLLLVDDR